MQQLFRKNIAAIRFIAIGVALKIVTVVVATWLISDMHRFVNTPL